MTHRDLLASIDDLTAKACGWCGVQLDENAASGDFCGPEHQQLWNEHRALPLDNYREAADTLDDAMRSDEAGIGGEQPGQRDLLGMLVGAALTHQDLEQLHEVLDGQLERQRQQADQIGQRRRRRFWLLLAAIIAVTLVGWPIQWATPDDPWWLDLAVLVVVQWPVFAAMTIWHRRALKRDSAAVEAIFAEPLVGEVEGSESGVTVRLAIGPRGSLADEDDAKDEDDEA